MKGCRNAILVTSLYLALYIISPYLGISFQVTAFMFVLSPFLLIWMVLSILINGKASNKTFEEGYFYEDQPPHK
ncbi:MAG: hypothetical protein ACFB0B_10880 [Thermonemataceae bacterium]